MSNELLFILSAGIDILFVFLAARLGLQWLMGTVAVNLVLVGIFGAKFITLFGLTTNAGNIFYACVFLATYFITERHGKRAGLGTIWFGVLCMVVFTALSQLAILFAGTAASEAVNTASATLFSFSPRVVAGSMLAFMFAQYVNVGVYSWLKTKTHGKHLWLRSNGANIIGQLVGSVLFFSIAFIDVPGPVLLQAIFAAWLIKIVVVMLGTPLLYLDIV